MSSNSSRFRGLGGHFEGGFILNVGNFSRDAQVEGR